MKNKISEFQGERTDHAAKIQYRIYSTDKLTPGEIAAAIQNKLLHTLLEKRAVAGGTGFYQIVRVHVVK